MNYTTNFNLRLPERNEQFNLDDWNNNTTSIDSAMQTNKTNISNNATNITSILNGLSTVNTEDTSSIYYKLMKLIYPVGSLYWSSKSTNPASLFGGTWVQIKDRFVLACGDTYKTVGATGGASTVTLTTSNMPSHSHSFTPEGGISGGAYEFTGNRGETGGMSGNATGSLRTSRSILGDDHRVSGSISAQKGYNGANGAYALSWSNSSIRENSTLSINVAHSHSFTPSGSISVTTNPTFNGLSGTTSSVGSGSAFSIMPPYVVKYCWERTA